MIREKYKEYQKPDPKAKHYELKKIKAEGIDSYSQRATDGYVFQRGTKNQE